MAFPDWHGIFDATQSERCDMFLRFDSRTVTRSVVTTWAASMLAVALVGCATLSAGAATASTSASTASPSGHEPPPAATAPTGPGISSLPWALRDKSADGKTLTIAYAIGDPGCVASQGLAVSETGSTVTITNAQKNKVLSAGEGCEFVMATGLGTVTLKSPLGNRQLVHAQLDKAWAAIASQVESELSG